MKFEIVKIILPLELHDYLAAYAEQRVQVWVNPPREIRRMREEILREYGRITTGLARAVMTPDTGVAVETETAKLDALKVRMFGWLAEIWSRHEDAESHWSVEEVQTLENVEPTLYNWLTRRTIEMITEFRSESKKK